MARQGKLREMMQREREDPVDANPRTRIKPGAVSGSWYVVTASVMFVGNSAEMGCATRQYDRRVRQDALASAHRHIGAMTSRIRCRPFTLRVSSSVPAPAPTQSLYTTQPRPQARVCMCVPLVLLGEI